MKFREYSGLMLPLLVAVISTGCGTKFGRSFEKQIGLTKSGIINTTTNIEEGVKQTCTDLPKVSANADEELRLVSSEDQTLFIVDGKEMGRAKQLSVCIDSQGEHTVIAKPPNCDEKTEKTKPPYDFPVYEFRFMLGECQAANTSAPQTTTATHDENRSLSGSQHKHKKK
jgi:hypothetical protein